MCYASRGRINIYYKTIRMQIIITNENMGLVFK